jgi:hypothetical protein
MDFLWKLEQRALYDVLQLCKKHTQACGQAVRLVPFHGILMSLMLEQEKQLRANRGIYSFVALFGFSKSFISNIQPTKGIGIFSSFPFRSQALEVKYWMSITSLACQIRHAFL